MTHTHDEHHHHGDDGSTLYHQHDGDDDHFHILDYLYGSTLADDATAGYGPADHNHD